MYTSYQQTKRPSMPVYSKAHLLAYLRKNLASYILKDMSTDTYFHVVLNTPIGLKTVAVELEESELSSYDEFTLDRIKYLFK